MNNNYMVSINGIRLSKLDFNINYSSILNIKKLEKFRIEPYSEYNRIIIGEINCNINKIYIKDNYLYCDAIFKSKYGLMYENYFSNKTIVFEPIFFPWNKLYRKQLKSFQLLINRDTLVDIRRKKLDKLINKIKEDGTTHMVL